MTPEEIRRLFTDAAPATDAEAARIEDAVRTDPAIARVHIATVLTLARTEQFFAALVSGWLGEMMVAEIQARAELDDAYALLAARTLLAVAAKLAPSAATPRGKPRPARTA